MKLLLITLLFSSLAFAAADNGKEVIIQNISQAQTINNSGANGYDGRAGENGYSYYSPNCSDGDNQSGGDGKNGDSGEDGGNGGNVIVHLSALSELSNLKIVSRGGRGGEGGKGGKGGSGCGSGHTGNNGQRGYDGSDGKAGKLYIVHHPKTFEKQQNEIHQNFSDLVKNQTVVVENIWDKHSGAIKLLAPDSIISSEYYIHNRTFKKKVIVNWLAAQDLTSFSKVGASVVVNNEKVSVNYNGAIALQEITESASEIVVTIHEMYMDSDLISFSEFKPQGIGQDIKFKFTDKGIKSPDMKVEYWVSASRERFFGGENFFFRKPAENFLSFEGKTTNLLVGKLDIPTNHLKKGSKLIITIDVCYTIGNQKKYHQFHLAYKVGTLNSKFQLENSSF